MSELVVVVEGQSEAEMVEAILVPHLDARAVYTQATIVTTSLEERTGKRNKGGGGWKTWRKDIENLLRRRSPDFYVTTLMDLYRLPGDFPDRARVQAIPDTVDRAAQAEAALAAAITDERFLPYVQRHEFESLVFAGLDALSSLLEAPRQLAGLERLRTSLGDLGPEDVNDGPATHPAARLLEVVPDYDKAFHGPLTCALTGLDRIRATCPRFDAWVTRLESLGSEQ